MLLTIRHGETPWKEIDARRHELHREFDAAFAATRLPEFPVTTERTGCWSRREEAWFDI
jgi:hypothetical protein